MGRKNGVDKARREKKTSSNKVSYQEQREKMINEFINIVTLS